jgi:co-chaperonin GroES (HSP10)
MHESFCRKMIGSDPDVKAYRVLLMTLSMPEKTKGGIILTDSSVGEVEKRFNIGQVLKVGPLAFANDGHTDHSCFKVDIGDWVHYSILEREPVVSNGKLCYYINDSRIYARIPEEDLGAFCSFLGKG